ncbi:MAG: DUF5317 domain-containing protein [Clostridia bacterium]|nr:DUF5317 domain-containing protein [Clostridia bacterium]
MVYLAAIAAGLLIGLLFRGKPSNLLSFKLKKTWILLLAFVLQSSSQILAVRGFDFAIRYSLLLNSIVFCMLLTVIWSNKQYLGILTVGLGCLLNALVMTLNGGKMPVSEELLLREQMFDILEIYRIGGDGKHILATDSTQLAFLGDMIDIPGKLGYIAKFISIGDVFVIMGLCILVIEIMIDRKFNVLSKSV